MSIISIPKHQEHTEINVTGTTIVNLPIPTSSSGTGSVDRKIVVLSTRFGKHDIKYTVSDGALSTNVPNGILWEHMDDPHFLGINGSVEVLFLEFWAADTLTTGGDPHWIGKYSRHSGNRALISQEDSTTLKIIESPSTTVGVPYGVPDIFTNNIILNENTFNGMAYANIPETNQDGGNSNFDLTATHLFTGDEFIFGHVVFGHNQQRGNVTWVWQHPEIFLFDDVYKIGLITKSHLFPQNIGEVVVAFKFCKVDQKCNGSEVLRPPIRVHVQEVFDAGSGSGSGSSS